ncbi:SDR family NAD(P)-dependent oxidoreductase [Pedobacter chinensis]|uniref:SDR family NAD(P)-dependent oxidoreductase n=1 Tax=Pedobacter chinensis TaxID=2282421 RepID=A0A369PYS3_9SPHI|nr:SDR family oxidoreductase [Pedobacter chinensis]RDC56355.1 SDR family NAD(P)-dependent oxidoreductase [Pedobacter chinensis]
MRNFKDKIIIITGGASGIGLALGKRFIAEGAVVVLSDLNDKAVRTQAEAIGAVSMTTDVSIEADIKHLIDQTIERFGRVDMFISNAGIAYPSDIDTITEKWEQIYAINVLAHVFAAKYVLPGMLQRGEGYLLNTASAAGLLCEFNAVTYTATKHAAVGLAEWLALTYKSRGIKVSVLCPAGVRTPMTAGSPSLLKYGIEVEEVVDQVISAIAEERFMISTHKFVDQLFQLKGNDYEKYMSAMEIYRKEAEDLDHK